MKVSCIVPLFNCQDFAIECIESIICQSYTDLEIILVDDGSTDRTSSICDDFSSKDRRVVVIHKINGGLSSARNAGVSAATGDYLCFVDGDDSVHPDYVSVLVKEVMENNAGVVSCGFHHVFNGQNLVYRKEWEVPSKVVYQATVYLQKMLMSDISCVVWNKIYKAEICKLINFKEGRLNEDYLYNYYYGKLLIDKGLLAVCVPNKLYYYRKNGNGITHARLQALLEDQVININEIVTDAISVSEGIYGAACDEQAKLYGRILHFLSVHGNDSSILLSYHKKYRSLSLRRIYRGCKKKELVIAILLWISPSFFTMIKRFLYSRHY